MQMDKRVSRTSDGDTPPGHSRRQGSSSRAGKQPKHKKILIVNCFFPDEGQPIKRSNQVPNAVAPALLAGYFDQQLCDIKLYNEVNRRPTAMGRHRWPSRGRPSARWISSPVSRLSSERGPTKTQGQWNGDAQSRYHGLVGWLDEQVGLLDEDRVLGARGENERQQYGTDQSSSSTMVARSM